MKRMRVPCPCCEYFVWESYKNAFDNICPLCGWQYDLVSNLSIETPLGPNKLSLIEARANYKSIGVSDPRLIDEWPRRKPKEKELLSNQ